MDRRHIFMRRLTVAALCVTIAGCTTRPEGTLIPVPHTVPGATIVNMLAFSTREPSMQPGVVFSNARGTALSLDNVLVSVPPSDQREIGSLVYPTKGNANPQTEFAVVARGPVTADQAQGWFEHSQGDANGELLIFVHGFNTRYEEAVYRFAQLVHDADIKAAPVLFTWPSRGSVFDYLYDRESANYSRDALEATIAAAVDAPEVTNITIMSHSMGGWLTMEALHQSAVRNGGLSPKISNVILAAPDVDVDVFDQQLSEIDTKHTQFTIFTSVDDRALQLSRGLAGGVTRLGLLDIDAPEVKRMAENRGVTMIDLSSEKSDSALNHSRFASSPEAVRLIGQRLIEGQTLTDARPTLDETLSATAVGTLRTVGSTVGVAASVPGALVSDQGRDELGKHIGTMRGTFSGTIKTVTGP